MKIGAKEIYRLIKNKVIHNKKCYYSENLGDAHYSILMLLEHYLNIKLSDIIVDKPMKIGINGINLLSSEILSNVKNERLDSLSFSKIGGGTPIEELRWIKIREAIIRLKNNEPIQYILEKINFFSLDFKINKNVLIPRPETEELVKFIIDDNYEKNLQSKEKLRILDIGTGSGCIAISLAKNLKNSAVDAIDYCSKALLVAKYNSQNHKTNVNFFLQNILTSHMIDKKWDIIVSNPPYVLQSEAKYMHKNVLNFEPQKAIFTSDQDPIIFYKRILAICNQHIANGGMLYLEVNDKFAESIVILFKNRFKNASISIFKDLNDKKRFIRVCF